MDLERKSISFGQRKTKRFIEIPIHPELEGWFTEHAAETQKNTAVFPSFFGKTIGGASGLSGQFARLMQKAGIVSQVTAKAGDKGRARSSHSFHSLRHSFNSAMANAGVPQELRQRLTGHASKAVNDRNRLSNPPGPVRAFSGQWLKLADELFDATATRGPLAGNYQSSTVWKRECGRILPARRSGGLHFSLVAAAVGGTCQADSAVD
ncbi:MAG: tyrosine-type recombinase/integrase [Opitutaceae bacterium]|nr:tyrosine-type recombinase/integrase [Opitutaceae bacterium]